MKTQWPNCGKQSCNICQKELRSNYALRKHLDMTHNSSGPKFKCDICSKGFSTILHFQRHKKHDKCNEGNACNICKIVLKNRQQLFGHVRNYHKPPEIKKYNCHRWAK